MGPQHPFADQFPNRQAWRLGKALRAGASLAPDPESLQRYIAGASDLLRSRKPELAVAWRAFVDRRLAGLPWPARPEQVHTATTARTRHLMRALRGPGRAPRSGPHTPAAPPPAVFYRCDTGEAVQISEAPPYLRPAGPVVETARPVGQPAPGGPRVYATRRQRAPGGPVPVGWVTEHVGRWRGRDTEVVYNPRRHQVMVTQVGHDVDGALEAAGWQRHATDGDRVVWTRDRLAATQAALARLDQATAIEPSAPELRPGLALER